MTAGQGGATAARPVCSWRSVAVVGGGCYGSFYARQLATAHERGAARWDELLIVDRDPDCRAARELRPDVGARLVVAEWAAWFGAWLDRMVDDADTAGRMLVPSPLMPHLLFDWLLARAARRWGPAVERVPVPAGPGTPFDWQAPDGTRYVSFADWTCPVHCIEPSTCPEIRAPRTWQMGDALRRLTERLDAAAPVAGPALFSCLHRTHGVGMIALDEAATAARLVDALEPGQALLVGTISACHGAASLLRRP